MRFASHGRRRGRGERHERRAGQAAEQRDDDDRLAVVGVEQSGDDGECCVVQRHRRHDADANADGVEVPQLRGVGPGTTSPPRRTLPTPSSSGRRSGRSSGPVRTSTDRWYGEHDGEGAVDLRLCPAELRDHRIRQRHEDVVEAAPRDELAKAEGAIPADTETGRAPARRRAVSSPSAGGCRRLVGRRATPGP